MNISTFAPIANDTNQNVSHPKALHVLLWTRSLPCHWIIFDGKTYWLMPANANGWTNRTLYRGNYRLYMAQHHFAAGIKLPFALHKIPAEASCLSWIEYQREYLPNPKAWHQNVDAMAAQWESNRFKAHDGEYVYHCYCGNSSFLLSAANVTDALEYAYKRFDDEAALTDTVTVVRQEDDGCGVDWSDSASRGI